MYEIRNLIYKHTTDAFFRLYAATAVWSPIVLKISDYTTGTLMIDINEVGASADSLGVNLRTELYTSPDSKSWFWHTAPPTLSSAGDSRTTKHYIKTYTDIPGGYLRLRYAGCVASANSYTDYRIRFELKNNNHPYR